MPSSDEVTTQAAQPKEASASRFAEEVASAGDSAAPTDLSREPSVSQPREAPSKKTAANGAAAAPPTGYLAGICTDGAGARS